MSRIDGGSPVKIEFSCSEEINAPDKPQARVAYNHTTENVIEIAQVFSYKAQRISELLDIENSEWKWKFVEWANEFEAGWEDDSARDYIEEITEFAEKKIDEYYKEHKERGL